MFIAEREGFEPPEPFSSTVFKTAVIDHSTTSPVLSIIPDICTCFPKRIAKVVIFCKQANFIQCILKKIMIIR